MIIKILIILSLKKKNKVTGKKIYSYRIKGINQKYVKNSYNIYKGDNKKYVNGENEEEEREESSNDENDGNIGTNKTQYINNKLNLDLLNNSNDNYVIESKINKDNIMKNNGNGNNENNNKEINNFVKRKNRKNMTGELRNMNQNTKNRLKNIYNDDSNIIRRRKRENTYEGLNLVGKHVFSLPEGYYKGLPKLKYKKAKIRKFKSHKGNFEDLPYPRRRNLYDPSYYKKSTLDDENIYEKINNNNCVQREKTKGKLRSNKKILKFNNSSSSNSDNDEHYYKMKKTCSKNHDKIRNIKTNTKNNTKNNSKVNNIIVDINNNKEQNNKQSNTLNAQNSQKKNNDNRKYKKRYIPHLNSSQCQFNPRLVADEPIKKSNSIERNNPNQEIQNDGYTLSFKKSFRKIDSSDMEGVDAIKSNIKKKLIEKNEKLLLDAIYYYNGPIDISCISSQNYTGTIYELKRRASKNGYKCDKRENNFFKFTNGLESFLVEIVKIKNNMLYYLINKSQ